MAKNVIIGILLVACLFTGALYFEESEVRQYWEEKATSRADEADFYRQIVVRTMFGSDEAAAAAVTAAAAAQANEYDFNWRHGLASEQQAKACAHDIAHKTSPVWRH